MRGDRLINWGITVTWAILPEYLENMVTIAVRDKLDDEQIEALAASLGRPLDNTHSVTIRDKVAVIDLIGPIFRYADMFSMISGASTLDDLSTDLSEVLANPAIESILLNIDSPGGDANGIVEFSGMIRDSSKPVTAYVGGSCCSAAYWIASAASKIVASPTAMIGSIGAVAVVKNPDAAKTGDRIEFVSSQSPNKRPNPNTESGKEEIQTRVDALAQVFIDDVAMLRGLTPKQVADTKGSVFIASAAKSISLIDEIGTFEGTLKALNNRRKPMGKLMDGLKALFAEEGINIETEDTEVAPVVAATPPTTQQMDPEALAELETLRANYARMEAEALTAKAQDFAKSAIYANRALPAELNDLVEAYLDAATDDQRSGPLSLAEGVTVTRVKRLSDRVNRRVPHTLVTSDSSKVSVVENKINSEQPETPAHLPTAGPKMSKERRNHLLSFSEEGQRIVNEREAGTR